MFICIFITLRVRQTFQMFFQHLQPKLTTRCYPFLCYYEKDRFFLIPANISYLSLTLLRYFYGDHIYEVLFNFDLLSLPGEESWLHHGFNHEAWPASWSRKFTFLSADKILVKIFFYKITSKKLLVKKKLQVKKIKFFFLAKIRYSTW